LGLHGFLGNMRERLFLILSSQKPLCGKMTVDSLPSAANKPTAFSDSILIKYQIPANFAGNGRFLCKICTAFVETPCV
jgi:hypothetical protein